MREQTMRTWLGVQLVTSHMLLIALCVVLYFCRGLLFEEMSTCVALVAPMFAVYGTAAMKHLLRPRNKHQDSRRIVNRSHALLILGLPGGFALLAAGLILAKAANLGFESFEQFKTTLALVQTGIGVYVGLIVTSMFETLPPATGRPDKTESKADRDGRD